ncbi:MAG: DUF58 domain-containing protein [Thermodesulfobacteriota bacterium]
MGFAAILDRLLKAPLSREPFVLTRGHIFILPTKYGMVFFLLFLAMMAGAVNYQINLGYGLAFVMGGSGLISLLHTFGNLLGLAISSEQPEPVFAGEMAKFPLQILENSGRQRYSIQLSESGPICLQDISRHQKNSACIYSLTESRGIKRLHACRVFTLYPFGLFRAWARIRPQTSCLVYPAPAEREAVETHFANLEELEGNSGRTLHFSGTDDFLKLRSAQAGDSFKRIDWKAFARQRGLVVKQFASTEQRTRWMDFEQIATEDTELKLSIMCRFVLDSYNSGIRFGIRLPGLRLDPNQGYRHKHACLKALALFEE